MPHSVFGSAGGGSGQRSKRGSSEHPGPRFDHGRANTSRQFGFDSGGEDVFSVRHLSSSVSRTATSKRDNGAEYEVAGTEEPIFPDGLLFKADFPTDDGDPWVDTDDGSEY